MIISTATKSLCERCNVDMKEKLAYEIYELIAASGLPLICIWINHRFILVNMYKLLQWRVTQVTWLCGMELLNSLISFLTDDRLELLYAKFSSNWTNGKKTKKEN